MRGSHLRDGEHIATHGAHARRQHEAAGAGGQTDGGAAGCAEAKGSGALGGAYDEPAPDAPFCALTLPLRLEQ